MINDEEKFMKLVYMIINYNDASSVLDLWNQIKDYASIDEVLVVDNHSSDDSFSVLKKIMNENKLVSDAVAYIGDDLNDLPAMKVCGCVGCPNDSTKEVLEYADYVCTKNGGAGAVREFIDYIVKECEHEKRK